MKVLATNPETNAITRIAFTVHGKPEPAGSKKGFPYKRKYGGTGVRIVDANDKAGPWKHAVAITASMAMDGRPLLTGPLYVRMSFFIARPMGHFGTGRNAGVLKRSAPLCPITRPDVLKFARGTEDACTGIVWRDDSQTVTLELHKVYGSPVRAEIEVRSLKLGTKGDG